MPILNARQLRDGMGPASLDELAALKKELALLSNAVDEAAKEKEQQMIKQRQAEMAKEMVIKDLERALLNVETARKDAVRVFEDLDMRSVSSKASRSSRSSWSSTFSPRKRNRNRKIFKTLSEKNAIVAQTLHTTPSRDRFGGSTMPAQHVYMDAQAESTAQHTRGLPLAVLEESRDNDDTPREIRTRSRPKERVTGAGEVDELRKELARLQNQLYHDGHQMNPNTASARSAIRSAPYPHNTNPKQVLFEIDESNDSLTADPLDRYRMTRDVKPIKPVQERVGWLEWLIGDADSCCSCCSSSPSGNYSVDSCNDLPLKYEYERYPSRSRKISGRRTRSAL